MPVTYLELENFKSYAGKQRIGPFQDFTSVIGPNGSGKSNLMDAISFVLGVQSRDLRSSQMKDLIFRPPGTTDEDLSASATLVYKAEDSDEETLFSRSISTKGVGDYSVNGHIVPFSKYEEALANIGVLLKGRNFLVFQGDVDSTARKTPKELVQWFEDISSSSELKERYEDAFEKMQDAEANARTASQKQKGFMKKRRELKNQKDEAEKFKGLVDSKVELLTEFFLWQLFHIRTDVEEKEDALTELSGELEESNGSVEEEAQKVRGTKKEASASRSVSSKLDKKRVKLVAEIDQSQPSIIKTEEEIKNLDKKIAAEKRKHIKIVKESETREDTLQTLEKEIKEYSETEEHLQQEYEEMKSQGNVALTEDQEAEYERIREAASVASGKPRHALGAANRRLESARVKAAALSEEMKEFKTRKAEASNKVTELTERRDKLGEVSWQISSKTRVFSPFLTVIVLLRLDRVSKKQEMIFKIARMN
jgi:structural maintenance of chromosome 1